MLQAAGESGPFILVGHSFGGLLSKQYAYRYPEDVSGILLIDSSIPGLQPDVTNSQLTITKLLRQLGMMRVMGDLNALPVPEAVLTDRLSRELLYKRFYNDNQISEIKEMANEQLPVVSLGDLPITIISSREEEKEHPSWQTLQDQYLALSSRSKRLIVEDASHYIHHDQPDIVLHEIYELLSVAGEQ